MDSTSIYLCCVELVIKLYSDKASRIGIRYIYEYQAVKEYEQLIQKYPDESFSIRIEFLRNKINLTLQGVHSGAKMQYRSLEFRLDQLQKLQSFYKPGMPMVFVHIFPKANTLYVAKPFRRESFIQVSAVQIINPVNADYH